MHECQDCPCQITLATLQLHPDNLDLKVFSFLPQYPCLIIPLSADFLVPSPSKFSLGYMSFFLNCFIFLCQSDKFHCQKLEKLGFQLLFPDQFPTNLLRTNGGVSNNLQPTIITVIQDRPHWDRYADPLYLNDIIPPSSYNPDAGFAMLGWDTSCWNFWITELVKLQVL